VEEEEVDPNRSGVGGGDVVRDCAVVEYVLSLFLPSSHLLSCPRFRHVDASYRSGQLPPYSYPYSSGKLIIRLPPVLCDPLVARAHYDKIEKEVEEGVRQSQIREKAMGQKKPQPTAGKE